MVLTFPGTRTGFAWGFDELRRALDSHPLEDRARYNCELVFEEVVTNIIRHGYRDSAKHEIEVAVDFSPHEIVMRFEDDGVPFDPPRHLPSPSTSIEDGGRGLILLRAAARRLDYERTPQQRNRLTVSVAAGG